MSVPSLSHRRPPRLPRLLRRAAATRSRRARRWSRRTIRRCCSPTPGWSSSRTSSPAARRAPTRGRPPRRSACAPAASTTTSRTSAAPRATTPSSRCWATSPSATTSRPTRSPSPGSCSPKMLTPSSTDLASPSSKARTESRRRRGARDLAEDRGRRRRSHHRPRRQGQLLGDGRHRPLRPLLGDPLLAGRRDTAPSRRPAATARSPACDCDRWIEIWNLVFMQFEQAAPEASSPPAAEASVDTGVGLERLCARAAGRALQLRHRPAAPARSIARRAREARGTAPTTTRDDERLAARHRRPRARHGLPDRRRRAARQRRPRLRAAADHAARHPPRPAAGHQASRS